MGVPPLSSLLQSVLSPSSSTDSSTDSITLPEMTLHSLSPAMPHMNKLSRPPTHVAFAISNKLYTWLETMALLHNYGSVHKSVRDILSWACTGQEEDLDWIFQTPHEVGIDSMTHFTSDSWTEHCSSADIEADLEAASIAERQSHAKLDQHNDMILFDVRVTESHFTWLNHIVQRYSLQTPAPILDIVCRCVIELAAVNDVFESDECGHDLPENTTQLYLDLGIISSISACIP